MEKKTPTFSAIANSQSRKQFNANDFPALGSPQTREEILMSNLLGNQQPKKVESNEQKYGLTGLKQVIRMSNPDLSMVSLGCDLTLLGLDLNSTENVYSTFMTPFSDKPTMGAEPTFPLLGYHIPIANALSNLAKLKDETLFFIFYSMPRDQLQEASAQELYKRKWRFHKEYKLWLRKEGNSEAISKGPDFERDVYVFFDPATWAPVVKEWVVYHDQLEERDLE